MAGPTQVANAIVQYTLTLVNNSRAEVNGITVTPSLAGFVLDPTLTPNPLPAGPCSIMAGAPITVNRDEEFVLGNELPAGLYLAKVIENDTSQTVKIIKE
ncbi:MAG: T9SS type A sorting domain-containing protein [Cytophagaceae bacterium]|nr:T9SS type A sorting domain-containing protein [Cytophagaceae bacterium]